MTEESGVLQFMGSQRVRHDLVTEQQQQLNIHGMVSFFYSKLHCFKDVYYFRCSPIMRNVNSLVLICGRNKHKTESLVNNVHRSGSI